MAAALSTRRANGALEQAEDIPTCEHEASPTTKYSVNRQATNTSRFLPTTGYSSLSAVMMASDPPNCETNHEKGTSPLMEPKAHYKTIF